MTRWRPLLFPLISGLALGCSDLLEVQDPDNIPPETLNNPAGATALYHGAIGDSPSPSTVGVTRSRGRSW